MEWKAIKNTRIFEEISMQVRELIESDGLKVGEKLPNEREMALQLGASRHAVREAYRSLEVTGWVEMRQGAHGGTFVAKGRPEAITEVVQRMFQAGEVTIHQLTEARLWIEASVIYALNEHLDADTIAVLEENIDRAEMATVSGNGAEKSRLNIRFHLLLAEGTKNPVLVITMQAVMAILNKFSTELGSVMGLDVIASRKRFMKHLRAGNVGQAVDEMSQHLRRLHEHYVRAADADGENHTKQGLEDVR
ncbi:MAG: GntR family transcriptional regulator [Marinosulfonomonas sp.]|nr:GntR family transcriptional regulator [Marinosulfonomonas sp.]